MKHVYLFALLILTQTGFSQAKLPVIKATSKSVSINDGGVLSKNSWTLLPRVRPDVYKAERTRKTKWVTFYTDIDSIRVKVKPGSRYNFVVLLNGKDSCYTQIASAIPPESLQSKSIKNDTIPFTLTAYNAIMVKAILNDTDTLKLHYDISSFDFHLTKETILNKTSLLSKQANPSAAPNFNKLNKAQTLKIGGLVWNNLEILPTNVTAHEMDGRIGWNVFEGKQVELDYDKNLMIIHTKLPKNLKGYTKAPVTFIHSDLTVKASVQINNQTYTGDFMLDNGSEQAMVLDSAFAARANLNSLKVIRSTTLHDATGRKYETKNIQVPLFSINQHMLNNVPASVLNYKSPTGYEVSFIGNDLFKRFNMILDLKNDNIYLKPNKLTAVKYRADS